MGRKKKDQTDRSDQTDRTDQGNQIAPPAAESPAEEVAALRDVQAAGVVELWPLGRLVEHPDNPRALRRESPKFRELVESIRANGIYEALTVRELVDGKHQWRAALGITFGEVLSGHRRLAAAREVGLTHAPVRNLGRIDDAAAFDIVAMANLHEELTPLEEGKRAATWLDKYHENVEAVAAKLGKSLHWVMTHAQIERGLSADWKKALAEWAGITDPYRQRFVRVVERWTAEHWARIARLPAGQQAHQLEKFRNDYRYADADEWTVKKLEELLKIDLLYLAKAPFPTGDGTKCAGCLERTGVQPLLFGESVEEAAGAKERCLNPKCWQSRTQKALREEFQAKAQEISETHVSPGKGRKLLDPQLSIRAEQVVPISMVKPPKGYHEEAAYAATMRPVKRALKGLLEADRITLVKEGTKGAVPGIVVAGRGKGSLQWVKIAEKEETRRNGPRPPSPAEVAKEKAKLEKRDRWRRVYGQAYRNIRTGSTMEPGTWEVLLCCVLTKSWPEGRERWRTDAKNEKRLAGLVKLAGGGVGGKIKSEELETRILAECWDAFRADLQQSIGQIDRTDVHHADMDYDRRTLSDLAPLFGIDLNHEYAVLEKAEKAEKGEKAERGDKSEEDAKAAAKCVEDCSACTLETCAKTGTPVCNTAAKRKRGRPRKAKAAAVGATHASPAPESPDGDLPEDEEIEDAGGDMAGRDEGDA